MKLKQINPLLQTLDTDIITQDKYVPGYVFIKTVQCTPVGSAAANSVARIVVDVPEAPVSKFRSIKFRFSQMGFASSGNLYFMPRKNGGRIVGPGATNPTVYFQGHSITAATPTLVYTNTNTTVNAENIQISYGSYLTTSAGARLVEITLDAFGFDSYVALSNGTTLPIGSIHFATGTYDMVSSGGSGVATNTPLYTGEEYFGISLGGPSTPAITNPRYSTSYYYNTPVYCDVYGILKNDPTY